jgi:chloramphenicol-sensitive protein RarD
VPPSTPSPRPGGVDGTVTPVSAGASGAPSEERIGVLAGIAAYGIWGLFPLYFHLLSPTTPVEILCHRILWSLLVVTAVLTARRDWAWVASLVRSPRRVLELAVAAVLIAVNWLVYVWAVEEGRVVDAALGYFINPLVTVTLGVVVLHERLRRLQWIAVGLGAIAVFVIGIGYGQFPVVALTLACSFAGYGFLKKRITLSPVQSLTAETGLLAPFAVVAMVVLRSTDGTVFANEGAGMSVLLATTGVVTAVPLVLFAASARRIPLTMLGLLQYLTPSLQFLCGVLVFHESMPAERWAGFALVWIALVCMSFDAVRQLRSGVARAASDEVVVAAAAELG